MVTEFCVWKYTITLLRYSYLSTQLGLFFQNFSQQQLVANYIYWD